MRVLIGCESSGTMRRAFRALGHDAWSCDVLPANDGDAHHIQDDVLAHLEESWDLAVFHPPCTHLSVSGARHHAAKREDGRQQAALDFAVKLWMAPIKHIALEQPVSVLASVLGPSHQTVQPWMFGHMEQKATCFWLKRLPPLQETCNVKAEMMKLSKQERERVHYMPPGPERWKARSKTFDGLAAAAADQWGGYAAFQRGQLELLEVA